MNVKEILSRNREIFEKLTGESAQAAAQAEKSTSQIKRAEFISEAQRPVFKAPDYNGQPNAARPIFSLHAAEGEVRDYFGAPDDVHYPEIPEKKQDETEDPLENLYYRLEVDARRDSQLLSEEE